MDAQVLNFKRYDSGAMVGWFDLGVCGIVVTGCKAFRKDDRIWFAWPSEKTTDPAGEEKYRDIVTAAEPVTRHLQNVIRGALRAAMDAKTAAGQTARPGNGKPRSSGSAFHKSSAEDLSEYRSSEADDDIPF